MSGAWGETWSFELHVHYGFVDLQSGGQAPADLVTARGGQANGLCGARYPGTLAMVTGLHTGTVPFTVAVGAQPPPLAEDWEDVVEVSFEALGPDCLLTTFDDAHRIALPEATTYRARYSASAMDAAREQDTRMQDEPVIDRYLLELWPAPAAPDAVVRETSSVASYWHRIARTSAPPPPQPTPEELAAAAAREQAERDARLAEHQRQQELVRWVGSPPDEALRAGGEGAAALARVDRALAERVASLDRSAQRRTAVWAARSACDLAGPGPLDWSAALEALDDDHALPPPFDEPAQAWARLYPPHRTTTVATVVMSEAATSTRRPAVAAPAAALAALLAAGNQDSAVAVFGALSQAASALDDPDTLYSALRERLHRA
ncbi:hypothetical protein [Phycicoccus sp. 3266]|uniref:hypothetical protein n=1 Tax=Phycicoccus sp. 3266 TaxID=2817751 RepID=UPI002855BFBA|nr:hypothetical protein [Phycicoccus sp. 3266]MDR6865029.1 hypothetical protein [Phycicoccus sp. 3266]